MNVKRLSALLLVLAPLTVYAAQGGWNASKSGVMLTYRGQLFNSSPLAPTPAQGVKTDNVITVVYWRYTVDGVYDPGLRVKLCTVQRCAEIEGGSGQTQAFRGLPATSEFRFTYFLEGKGCVYRPIDIRQVEIAVNYE
ncbi:MAG: flagellar protein FlhE [Symbiopectobacterium sp.]|uniref:flagellar protein FlhE n=1 Tax=Symbiopectobacterium sp. TaxID=2952789 RepID=UPI0039ED4A58